MQCPDCKIYFDDEEKACPMCGKKRVTMGRSGQQNTITPSVMPMREGKQIRRTYHAPRMNNPVPRKANSTKQVRTVVVILVVLWILIVFFSVASRIGSGYVGTGNGYSTVPEWNQDDWGYYEDDDYGWDYEEIPTVELLPEGISLEAGEERLEITFSENDSYQLTRVGSTWSATESGWAYTYESEYYYDEQYRAERYACYELNLCPYEFTVDGTGYDDQEWEFFYDSVGDEYRALVVYVDRETGEYTLYDYYDENFELLLNNTYVSLGTDNSNGLALGGQAAQVVPNVASKSIHN